MMIKGIYFILYILIYIYLILFFFIFFYFFFRFEKISHIIKTFKLSCINTKSHFQSMHIKTKNFSTYLEEFNRSTYIMIIINDKSVNNELLKLNIDLSRSIFEDIINNEQ